jgi:hypothetical protein
MARRTARRVALVAAGVVLAVMLGLLFGTFRGNSTGFFRIGDYRPRPPALSGRAVFVFPHQAGYDGQYYLAVALDPALRDPGTLQTLDHPQYRCRRILFPLLGRALGLGQPGLIPYALPLLNMIAAVMLVWLVARWWQIGGGSGWGGLLVLGVLGIWEVLALTTTDLVSTTLFVATLYALRLGRFPWAALALACAALTREVMLLYWLAMLGGLLAARQWRAMRWLVWAGLPAIAWNLYVRQHIPAGAGGNVVQILFGLPGVGWLGKGRAMLADGLTGKNLFELLVFLSFLAVLGALLANLWRLRAVRAIWPAAAVALLLAAMLLCAKFFLLNYYLDYSRVFQDLFVLLVLSLGFPAARRYPAYAVLGLAGISSVAFLLHYALGIS